MVHKPRVFILWPLKLKFMNHAVGHRKPILVLNEKKEKKKSD